MDEPSSSLTSQELKRLGIIIHQLREKGISIIYISHKLDEIFEYCDIVTVLRDGRVIDTKPVGEITREEMITKMVGRTIENEFPPRAHFVGEPLLEVRNLNTRKLHNINFTLHKGEILGLVGLVGAGRTEIIRALYGADKVRGHEVPRGKPVIETQAGNQCRHSMVPEDRKREGLVLPFSVENNITWHVWSADQIWIVSRAPREGCARRQVKHCQLEHHRRQPKYYSFRRKPAEMSLGADELDPDILILDEPTRIDVGAK